MSKIRDLMRHDPITVTSNETIDSVARRMRDGDVGAVLVAREDTGGLAGILTDRDLVLRVLAKGNDPARTLAGDICSGAELHTLQPDDSDERAVELMKAHAIRRVPVVEAGRGVGIVSLGDLAVKRDPSSALGQISAAPPNH